MDSRSVSSRMFNQLAFAFSCAFLAAALFGGLYTGELTQLLRQWFVIMISPSPLVTDYFNIGSLGSAFLNAAACGFACTFFMFFLKGESRATTLAGYFLVVAHAFYGLNFFNMWPCFFASMGYLHFKKLDLKKNLHICMFSTCFAPLIGELLFRYTQQDSFVFGEVHLTAAGLLLTLIASIFLGAVIPAILPGAAAWHKGYDLYNGGLAFGMLGFFLFNFLFRTLGMNHYGHLTIINPVYNAYANSYRLFCNIFFVTIFLFLIFLGWSRNGHSFAGYGRLMKDTGHQADFAVSYGNDLVIMNIGFVGLLFLSYLNMTILFSEGAGFTGPSVGVTIAALTFTAMGQHPANVWPILMGYQLLYSLISIICPIAGLPIPWTLSTQGYINGAAFATGLCPIVGRYGFRAGILAGMMCASMCTSTSALHGGYVLYNGGLTAGITALILLPILEHYIPKARKELTYPKLDVTEMIALEEGSEDTISFK